MKEKLVEGWYGNAKFTITKHGRKQDFDIYGTIIQVEPNFVLFKDNEKFLYLVQRKDFHFTQLEFVNLAAK